MADTGSAGGGGRYSAVVVAQLSVMMFLQFFLWGAWYVTMGPFMDARGIDAGLIGTAYSVGPIAAILSPFFLGLVADRYFPTERVLGVMHLLGGAALFAAPAAASVSPELFIGVVLVHMLCYMPTLGLTNTLAFHAMTNAEKQFPLVRVWGTIGWIAANWMISLLAFDTSASMFYVAGGSGLLLGVYSFFLPHTPPPARGTRFSARDALGLDAIALLRDRNFAVFVACSFLLCIPLAAYYAFAGEFVGDMGFKQIAATMSLGQMSEIAFMLVMPLAFARLGVKWMLLIGMGAWVLRYGLFAGAADESVRWMVLGGVLGGVLLHGICYDFFFVTGQIYVDRKADRRIRGQAQGFLVLITQGLGMLIGAQLMGQYVQSNTSEVRADAAMVETDAGGEAAAPAGPVTPTPSPAVGEDGDAGMPDAGTPEAGTPEADGTPEAGSGASAGAGAADAAATVKVRDWGTIWQAPAIFAGVIMAVFFVLFRGGKGRGGASGG